MKFRIPLPNVLSILIVVLLAAAYFGVFADLDWSWHVRTGALIVQSSSLRTPDTFSYTIGGKLLHDFEWLYEVLLWAAWTGFGMGGLKFLKIVLVVTPLFLVARQLERQGVRWHGIALSLITAIFVLSAFWNLRPLVWQ